MLLAIDIGTSNSSAAIIENGAPTAIKIGAEDYAVPSAAFVDESGKLLISSAAISKRAASPTRFKDNFKRDFGMGKSYELGGVAVTPEEIYEAYYRFFKQGYEQTGAVIDKVVATHPANFSEQRKGLLRDILNAVFQLDEDKIILIEEPRAALYHFPLEQVKAGDVLLIYDFGGGTLDVAIAEVTDKGFRVAGYQGTDLGGTDFDSLIRQDIIERLGVSANHLSNPQFKQLIFQIAQTAKHQLSVSEEFNTMLSFDYENYSITRAHFKEMAAQLMNRSDELIERLLESCGYEKKEVTRVLCVGGSSCIPFVPASVENALGKRPLTSPKPDLAVCLGGAGMRDEVKTKVNAVVNEDEVPDFSKAIAELEPETLEQIPEAADVQQSSYAQWDNCKFYIENEKLYMNGNGYLNKLLATKVSNSTFNEIYDRNKPIYNKGYLYYLRTKSNITELWQYDLSANMNNERRIYQCKNIADVVLYQDSLYVFNNLRARILKIRCPYISGRGLFNTSFTSDRKYICNISAENNLITFTVNDYPEGTGIYNVNQINCELNLETGEVKEVEQPQTNSEDIPQTAHTQWDNCKFYMRDAGIYVDGNGYTGKLLLSGVTRNRLYRGEDFVYRNGYIYYAKSKSLCRFDLSLNREKILFQDRFDIRFFKLFNNDLCFIATYPVRVLIIRNPDTNDKVDTVFKSDRNFIDRVEISAKNHLLNFRAHNYKLTKGITHWLARHTNETLGNLVYSTNLINYELNLETGIVRQL